MKYVPKSHGTVVAYLALFVALSGTAVAAAPLALQLGKSNGEKAPTSLTNTGTGRALNLIAKNGSALSLVAPATTPPLTVNNTTQIPKLNASLLGGKDASSFQAKIAGATCSNGIATIDAAGAVTCAALQTGTMSFTSSGSGSVVIPEGVKSVVADLWGGGGGGDYFCVTVQPGHIFGGGQGGHVQIALAVTSGQTIAFAVGAGGETGYNQFNGGTGATGGDTTLSIGSTLVATASGGVGGGDDYFGGSGGQGGGFSIGNGAVGLQGAAGANSTATVPGGQVGFVGSGGEAGGLSCGGHLSSAGAVLLHFSTS